MGQMFQSPLPEMGYFLLGRVGEEGAYFLPCDTKFSGVITKCFRRVVEGVSFPPVRGGKLIHFVCNLCDAGHAWPSIHYATFFLEIN